MKTSTKPQSLKDISLDFLLSQSKQRGEPDWLISLRSQAFENFRRLSWPNSKNEHWKRTEINISQFESAEVSFQFPSLLDSIEDVNPTLKDALSSDQANGLIPARAAWGFSEGQIIELPESLKERGVEWISLEVAIKTQAEKLQPAWAQAVERAKDDKFKSLSLAFANGGFCLIVPKGQIIKIPFQSFVCTEPKSGAQFPLNFIFLEEAAEAHAWEELMSEKDSASVVVGTTFIHLKENAKISCYFLQHWNNDTTHLQFQYVSQGAFSKYNAIALSLGSMVNHVESHIQLDGQGAENKVLGVIFGTEKQNFVNWITQNHTAPRTISDIQYRGALKGSAHSFFSGMVYITKEAQKSDAYQAAKYLLLSKEARADAIPNLEILADDVKCSHGAAVGPVDQDQKYYLQSRGVPPEKAEEIIIQGFIEPVIAEVPSQIVQDKLRDFIERKISSS